MKTCRICPSVTIFDPMVDFNEHSSRSGARPRCLLTSKQCTATVTIVIAVVCGIVLRRRVSCSSDCDGRSRFYSGVDLEWRPCLAKYVTRKEGVPLIGRSHIQETQQFKEWRNKRCDLIFLFYPELVYRDLHRF